MENSRDTTIAAIKAAFKRRGFRYSVTGGRGTAWGWITIDLLPAVYKGCWNGDAESSREKRLSLYREMADRLGNPHGEGYGTVSIPASTDYYREYIDRAEGRKPAVIGQPYWD